VNQAASTQEKMHADSSKGWVSTIQTAAEAESYHIALTTNGGKVVLRKEDFKGNEGAGVERGRLDGDDRGDILLITSSAWEKDIIV